LPPARAGGKVRAGVWNLAHHTAGMVLRFATDAATLAVDWTLWDGRRAWGDNPGLAMPHMPATGVSGLDLYVRHNGAWHWLANARPLAMPQNRVDLFSGLPPVRREYMLYLPLYHTISAIEIGVPTGASLWPAPPRAAKPIVFYGTSITQGGCASRPGMCYTSIVGRRLEWPVINLGFSGNGQAEPEMAELIAEIDASIFVVDCIANVSLEMQRERLEPFVRCLRASHPATPIVLMESVTFCHAFLVEATARDTAGKNALLRTQYEKLKTEGVSGLHYLPGDALLGADGEGAVDGVHPTDLGFLRMADVVTPALAPLLPRPGG